VLRLQKNKPKPPQKPPSPLTHHTTTPETSTLRPANAKTTETHFGLTTSSECPGGTLFNSKPAGLNTQAPVPQRSLPHRLQYSAKYSATFREQQSSDIEVSCCQSLRPCSWEHYNFPGKQQL